MALYKLGRPSSPDTKAAGILILAFLAYRVVRKKSVFNPPNHVNSVLAARGTKTYLMAFAINCNMVPRKAKGLSGSSFR